MSEFGHLVDFIRNKIPSNLDVCVSFVLYKNDNQEIADAISQIYSSSIKSHIVIIDNSTPPLDLGFAKLMGATVVATNKNIGYGRGHNIALDASKDKCRYNIVMNTDLKTKGDVIGGMIDFMDNHTDAGLAMPRVCYPDGSLQRLCRLLPNPTDIIARRVLYRTNWGKNRNKRYEFHNWDYDSVAEFPFLSGCFMILRQDVLKKVGHFDERYFLYAEDLDLSRRITKVSKTLYNPKETVVHEYRSQSKPSWARKRYALVSLTRYFSKWGWIIDQERDSINKTSIDQFYQNN